MFTSYYYRPNDRDGNSAWEILRMTECLMATWESGERWRYLPWIFTYERSWVKFLPEAESHTQPSWLRLSALSMTPHNFLWGIMLWRLNVLGIQRLEFLVLLCSSLNPKEMWVKVLTGNVNNGQGEHEHRPSSDEGISLDWRVSVTEMTKLSQRC